MEAVLIYAQPANWPTTLSSYPVNIILKIKSTGQSYNGLLWSDSTTGNTALLFPDIETEAIPYNDVEAEVIDDSGNGYPTFNITIENPMNVMMTGAVVNGTDVVFKPISKLPVGQLVFIGFEDTDNSVLTALQEYIEKYSDWPVEFKYTGQNSSGRYYLFYGLVGQDNLLEAQVIIKTPNTIYYTSGYGSGLFGVQNTPSYVMGPGSSIEVNGGSPPTPESVSGYYGNTNSIQLESEEVTGYYSSQENITLESQDITGYYGQTDSVELSAQSVGGNYGNMDNVVLNYENITGYFGASEELILEKQSINGVYSRMFKTSLQDIEQPQPAPQPPPPQTIKGLKTHCCSDLKVNT